METLKKWLRLLGVIAAFLGLLMALVDFWKSASAVIEMMRLDDGPDIPIEDWDKTDDLDEEDDERHAPADA